MRPVARQTLQEQIKTNPRNFEALTELGNMQFDQKNYKEAANWYAKAIDVRPDELDLRTDLGTALFYDNQFDAAIAQFKDTLARNPNHPQALFNIGVALLE